MLLMNLLRKNQKELCNYVRNKIPKGFSFYYKPNEYIYIVHKEAKNKSLPLLLSHLDTVDNQSLDFRHKPIELTDTPKGKVVSIENTREYSCLGGDDRCGVWIMLQLIKSNPKDYKFLFTFDEETGGKGGYSFVKSKYFNEKFFTCFVSLDRRSPDGNNEVALYGYDNIDLVGIFEVEGYNVAYGSFTDCVTLSEASKLSCVNLSVGYDNEHTTQEVIYLDSMYNTLATLRKQRVIQQLQQTFIADVKPSYTYNYLGYDDMYDAVEVCCEICGNHDKLYLVNGYMMCSMCVEEDFRF